MKRFAMQFAACALLACVLSACAAKTPIPPGLDGEWQLDAFSGDKIASISLLLGALGFSVPEFRGVRLSVDTASATARFAPLTDRQGFAPHVSLALRQENGVTVATFADGPEFELRSQARDTLVLSTRGPIGASFTFSRLSPLPNLPRSQ